MKVALFVTCLVDQFFPQVGVATIKILRHLGCQVEFPRTQTCCGQPAFNSGFRAEAKRVAQKFIKEFEPYEYIVAPSGSCTAMVAHFYKELFSDEPQTLEKVHQLAAKIYELSDFLVNVLHVEDVGAEFRGKVTYHDACHLLRNLQVRDEPRRLLRAVRHCEFVELPNTEQCCGFGGTFAVKLPDISMGIVEEKIKNTVASGANVLVACDLSCLMHIAGAMSRQNVPVKTMHLAELLAMGLKEP